jgi:hypothetical protein
LDWILIFNRRHLESELSAYIGHYNAARSHRGIDLDVPLQPVQPVPAAAGEIGRVERVDVLGGLIHEHRHAA